MILIQLKYDNHSSYKRQIQHLLEIAGTMTLSDLHSDDTVKWLQVYDT